MAEKFLVIKGAAGMSNRLRVALTGILYALVTGRTLVVDWRDPSYSRDGSNAFPGYFAVKGLPYAEALPPGGSVYPAIWEGNLDKSASALWAEMDPEARGQSLFAARPLLSLPDIADVRRTEDVVVYWGTEQKIMPLAPYLTLDPDMVFYGGDRDALVVLLNHFLELRPAVREPVEALRRACFRERMLGVHVRHSCIRSPLPRFFTAVTRFRAARPDHGLFLATDNAGVLDRFREVFGEVVSADKWYPPAGEMMGENPDCPDPFAQGAQALTDMWLLSACDHLMYYSQSTFYQIPLLLRRYAPDHLHDVGFMD